jgi:hypothetical protein
MGESQSSYEDGNSSGSSNGHGSASAQEPRLDKASKRRAYFGDAKNRRKLTFGPEVSPLPFTLHIRNLKI